MEKKLENYENTDADETKVAEKAPFNSQAEADKKNVKYKSYTMGKRLGIKR